MPCFHWERQLQGGSSDATTRTVTTRWDDRATAQVPGIQLNPHKRTNKADESLRGLAHRCLFVDSLQEERS